MSAIQSQRLPSGVGFRVTLAGQADPVCAILCERKSNYFFQYANTWAKSAAHYAQNIGNSTSVLQTSVKLEDWIWPAEDLLKLDQQIEGIDLKTVGIQIAKVSDKIVGIGFGSNKDCVKRGALLAVAGGLHVKEHLECMLQPEHLQMRKEVGVMPMVSGTLQPLVESTQQEHPSKSRSRSARRRSFLSEGS